MRQTLLYKNITADIVEAITEGSLKPGDKIPSANDLRKRYGVSHITALRTYRELTDGNYVTQKTGQGYFVRDQESLNRQEVTGAIGCIVRPLNKLPLDNYSNDIFMGIQREIYHKRRNLISPYPAEALNIHYPNEQQMNEIQQGMLEIAKQVDGFLVDERIADTVIDKVLDKTGKPMVIINRTSSLKVDTVVPNNAAGIEKLIETAQRLGYTYFIYCVSGFPRSNYLECFDAFNEMIADKRISLDNCCIIDNCLKNPFEKTLAGIQDFYDSVKNKGKVLLMAPRDKFARTCCDTFIEKGFKIPDDIGISGFNGTGHAYCRKPELTTIKIDPEELGVKAVNILTDRITNPAYSPPGNHKIDVSLSFGKSM